MRRTVSEGVITGRGTRTRTLLLTLVALLFVAGGTFPTGVAAAAPASANRVTVGAKAVVTNTDGDPIRIRGGASIEHAKIAWAREGDVVSVLAGPVTDDSGIVWFNVQTPEVKGWMMAQYLRGTGESPAAAAPADTAGTAAARLSGNARVANTDGDRLRVRSTPRAAGTVIGYLDPGDAVAIEEGPLTDAAGIVWYRVRVNDLAGWCMSQFLAQTDAPRAAPAQAEPASNSVPATRVSLEQLRQWVDEARAQYPYAESADKMWRVMMCESGGNPNAVGSGRYYGLFQYLPGTWGGGWNPYRNESIWDAKSQIFATARAWSISMQSHWSCYRLTGGANDT